MDSADVVFSHRLRVRYAEVDSQGIVFNAHYLMYFDVAVTEYFRAMLMPYTEFVAAHGLDFHVSHVELDYKKPAHTDDEIHIRLNAFFSKAIVRWNFTMSRENDLLCSGRVDYVCVDKTTGKVKRVPSEIAEKLGWKPSLSNS